MTRILPIFPLPDTVFFPGTNLTLRVFEPRYKDMVRDAAAGNGLIVVSLQAGDGFHELGTVGRIRELTPLEDGRLVLELTGLARMSLAEVPVTTSYRQVRVEARLQLLASYGMLRSMVRGSEPLVPQRDLPFEVVVNMACASLPIDASRQQELLHEDTLIGRQRLGLEYFSTAIEMLSWPRAMKGSGSSLAN